ncbi:MAG: L-idonate 5-dehydrogenase [Polaromonas sp.]|nr:L-idonate 5-dehydrogenase [Polaromonas sp.]
MRALVCHAPLDLRLDQWDRSPDPDAGQPGPTELGLRIAFGGICGSDLHYFQHGGFGTVRIREPMVLGHEVSGVVESVGSAVTAFEVGQRVAVSPSRPCGLCAYCNLGLQNHCMEMRFYGSAMRFPHVQGAFRERLVIDASQAHLVADDLPLSEATLAEPLSVGLHAITRAGSVFGKRVLVTGCGPIGLLLIAGLRRAGAAHIIAADISELPLSCAQRMGADQAINLAKQPGGLAPFALNKGMIDVMFEASGSDKALRTGLDVMTPRGVVVIVGLGGDISMPMNLLVAKELDVRGTFRFHAEFAVAVRFLNQRLIDVRPVITHTLKFTDAIDAFKLAGDKGRALKVLIDFSSTAAA